MRGYVWKATEFNAGAVKEDATRLGEVLERQDAHGEEAMMAGILFNRGDRWIREMAKLYKATYGRGPAKAVRRHSRISWYVPLTVTNTFAVLTLS